MNAERLIMILREPHTSEKTTVMAEKFRQFTFKVLKDASKPEIKQAVEKMFNVKVTNVSVVNVKGKKKRFKQLNGQRSDWRKAFVTLHPESDIDFSVAE